MKITQAQVKKQLKKVLDPELGMNIVDLGFIKQVKTEENGEVAIKMTLTSPHCPFMAGITADVKRAVKKIIGVKKVKVELFNP